MTFKHSIITVQSGLLSVPGEEDSLQIGMPRGPHGRQEVQQQTNKPEVERLMVKTETFFSFFSPKRVLNDRMSTFGQQWRDDALT